MREGHRCGQMWRMWERRARRPTSCSPRASLNESLHQGGKKLTRRWKSKEEEACKWDVDMEAATMKAGGKTIPPDHLLPQMPHCKVGSEREQKGTVYWWNTTRGRSHATPQSREAAAAGGSPLLLFLLTARFLYNQWRNIAAPECNSSYPKTAIWAHSQWAFPYQYSCTLSLLTTRNPDACVTGSILDEVNPSHTGSRELLLFSWGVI